ncbi:MAG: potassium transporter TrkG [Pseudomonadota bacterium]
MHGRPVPLRAQMLALPLFLLIFGIASAAMLVPAAYAGIVREHAIGRAFLYSGLLGLILFGLIALAHWGRSPGHGPLGPLVSLFSAFVFLPLGLAVPFHEGLGTSSFLNAYVEMVSAITTTGAPMFEHGRLSAPLHLWRGIVGWMGGLLMWIAASAILAPLNLGGFEITARAEPGRADVRPGRALQPEGRARLVRVAAALVPVYAGLTLVLYIALMIAGERSFTAAMHAMGIMATSGITGGGGLEFARAGWVGEALMVLFMLFALSRMTFTQDTVMRKSRGLPGLWRDPEFRIGIGLAVLVPLALFLRHWIGSYEEAEGGLTEAVQALWGGFYTVVSFLTTTGYQSAWWDTAQDWSGLGTPGLILMGLALIGGGVATTAGGVKLLRVFALYQNGYREMERLVHPSSVSRASALGRRVHRDGAFIAWIFFMLFALSLAGVTMLLALLGTPFEASMKLALAALTTTGPVLDIASLGEVRLVELGPWSKGVFAAAMVLGRLETLAIIALVTPDLWRPGATRGIGP